MAFTWDWAGVAMAVIGAWILVGTISGLVGSRPGTALGWFWTILWLGGGVALIYYAYPRLFPPESFLPQIVGGRRHRYI